MAIVGPRQPTSSQGPVKAALEAQEQVVRVGPVVELLEQVGDELCANVSAGNCSIGSRRGDRDAKQRVHRIPSLQARRPSRESSASH